MKYPQNVEVNIGELILRGFSISDRHSLRDAVERELERCLSEQRRPLLLESPIAVDQLEGSFEVPVGGPARQIGERVARAIYEAFNPAPNVERTTKQ